MSCLSQGYIVQVSDKRITRALEVIEDDRNKGVLFNASMAFAYTGLAQLEGKPTDQWLAEVLEKSKDPRPDLERVRAEASRVFSSLNGPPQAKRHAFAGVGYIPSPQFRTFVAEQFTISNFLSPEGEWLADAGESFSVLRETLPPEQTCHLTRPLGARVNDAVLGELYQRIRKCIKAETHPLEVIALICDAMEGIAASEYTVGRRLLVSYIPRCAIGITRVYTPMGSLESSGWDRPLFFEYSGDVKSAYLRSPRIVYPGLSTEMMIAVADKAEDVVKPLPEERLDANSYRRYLAHSQQVADIADHVRTWRSGY